MKANKTPDKKRGDVACSCNGKGYVFENGIVHTCWACLKAGRLQ